MEKDINSILEEIEAYIKSFNETFKEEDILSGLEKNVNLSVHHLNIGYELLYHFDSKLSEKMKTVLRDVILRKAGQYSDVIIASAEI